VRAALELHAVVGPAATSLSAVAERAGVQRNTLYRHFPDERSLFYACSGLHVDEHPMPDVAAWRVVADPAERAARGLGQLYAYWKETETLTANVLRDAEVDAVVREVNEDRVAGLMAAMRDALLDAWPQRDRSERLVAMVELALAFHTWQSLVRRSGLANADAASLMASSFVAAAAAGGGAAESAA